MNYTQLPPVLRYTMARRLTKNSPEWCTVSAVDDDLMHWNAMLAGPEDSPYAGGVFNLDLQFPSEYPFKAPKVRFLTRVYHPNVKSQSGEICADVINENWGPTLNVLHCLTAIKQILEQPDMDNPLEPDIAKQMHENKADFEKTAQDWTKQYASTHTSRTGQSLKTIISLNAIIMSDLKHNVMSLFLLLCALLATPTAVFGRRPIVNNDPAPPAVLWYAPFLSGGGYCSEAHSYVVAVDTAMGKSSVSASSCSNAEDSEDEQDAKALEKPFELLITQHGDSLNPSFIRDLPADMKSKLEHHWIEERDFYWRLKNRKVALAICHSEPGAWAPAHYMTSRCPPEKAQYKVGRTMFETDRVPKGWPDRMNKMDEIWVPTKFQEKIFVDGGVKPEAVMVVPEVVDVDFFDPKKVEKVYDLASETAFEMTEKTTVYLSIFKWEERKAWRVLLKAYFEAFKAEDDVVLVLLTNGYHTASSSAEDFMGVIEKFSIEAVGKKLNELPHIHVLPPHIPQAAMPSLYKAANAFVLPSRGEGWGRPHVEAMAMERPLIATFWSGTTEYMTEENSYPLEIDGLIELMQCMLYEQIKEGAFRGHMWADPSVRHLKELLIRIKEHPEEAIAKGKRARKDMVEKYSPEIIGEIVLGHITRILEHVATQEKASEAAEHEEL
ncbi:Ubiquitin conjugating enzyme E2 B [Phytophthora citrophthora]|uniref:E2 ubiquitin-conjugating enzyme n=1 Tax=Phytophthora citrophthora TaxID=4793 RepID=A0AAD9H1B7_9STRA|nr:Ubiquitin conjugating enzyme E2 B [Phytophthora citrophthora]